MKIKKIFLVIGFILLCETAGGVGSLFTVSAIPTWYAGLAKPFFSPPNYLFGPVWTILYALMGISLYLVWTSKSKLKKKALFLFSIQLFLNTLWSIIFFGMRNPFLGLIEILCMWVAIFLTIRVFARISKNASYLLYPYLAWVSFATILNFSIWILNK